MLIQPESGFRQRAFVLPLLVFAWITLVVGTAANGPALALTAASPRTSICSSATRSTSKSGSGARRRSSPCSRRSAPPGSTGGSRWRPRWLGAAHRWSGRVAFALTLPVAYHCIFLLGFQDTGARALAHSFAGLFLYGALAAKVLVVRSSKFPGWLLPVMGGLVFAILIAVWYTSSLWFFRTIDVGI